MGVLVEDGAQVTVPEFDEAIKELDKEQYADGVAFSGQPKPEEGATAEANKTEGPAPNAEKQEKPEAEAGAEGEDRPAGEVPQAEQQTPPKFEIPEDMKAIVPETIADQDAYNAFVKDLHAKYDEERRANEEFVAMLEENNALLDVMQEMKRNGTTFYEAARKVMELNEEDQIPDPQTPEYREFVRKQIEREESRKHQLAAEKEMEGKIRAAEADAQTRREAFLKANPDITNERFGEFQAFVRSVTVGDPSTGKINPNFFPLMWKAFTFDEQIRKAQEKGRVEGKNEVIAKNLKLKTPTAGDGLPHFQGGKPPAETRDNLSDLEESLKPTRIFES